MRTVFRMLMAACWLGSITGCAATQGVRYVYQDGEFGVVGIPENTDRWPTHYRRQAEELMSAHFPEGHEIVRAEEVVEGSRTLTVEGTNSAELLPQLPVALMQVGKLGRSAVHVQADRVKIKECRIVYRRALRPTMHPAYADVATVTPPRYVDPNDPERRKLAEAETPGDDGPAPRVAKAKDDEPKHDDATEVAHIRDEKGQHGPHEARSSRDRAEVLRNERP